MVSLPYSHDYEACIQAYATEQPAYAALREKMAHALKLLYAESPADFQHIQRHIQTEQDVAVSKEWAARIHHRFRHVVVIATGGSALNGQALAGLAAVNIQQQERLQLHFLDYADSAAVHRLWQNLPLSDTFVIVISKSGVTLQILAQTLVAHVAFEAQQLPINEHFLIITLPNDNPLHAFAKIHALSFLPHPAMSGRYSIFSVVGLLPAALLNIDITALLQGAQTTFAAHARAEISLPASEGAALSLWLEQQHITMNVWMPYDQRLQGYTEWCRQIWAESLGKQGKGTTFFPAMGTLDQHSQLQLYLDGPTDKWFTFITNDEADERYIPSLHSFQYPEFRMLEGHTLHSLLQAERQATITTLQQTGRPVRLLHLPTLNAYGLGALIMHFMLETILVAHHYHLNPFDQPAVERGKELTRHLLAASSKPHGNTYLNL